MTRAGLDRHPKVIAFALAALVAVAAGNPCDAQSAKAQKDYDNRKRKVLWESGQGHVRVGMWARKLGLNAQATTEFLLVEEVSEGINTGGRFLLSLQRQYGEDFWKKHLKRVPRRLVRQYEKKAKAQLRDDRKERFKLAKYAHKRKLTDEAFRHYETLLRSSTGALVYDAKGGIPLDCGTVPVEYAKRFESEAVKVGGKLQVRDELLKELGEVGELFVADSEALRVRSEISQKQADKLHALLSKLMPHLERAVGGIPTRKLDVFVFAQRAAFEAYVARAGWGETSAHGMMDPRTYSALVCAEGRAPAVVQALALHELTHLYDYAVSRASFPSWYTEGFAETYGGIGTFALEGDELRLGGPMATYRIEPLKRDAGLLPLREMLAMDGKKLIAADVDRATQFYAQSWAFLRYLKTAADDDVKKKFALWELRCRGGAIGAVAGKRTVWNHQQAADLFDAEFESRLDELEAGFREWIATL